MCGRCWNSSFQTRKYTTYTRDGNQSDEAMARRYNRWHLRFDQPDPYDGSYDLTDPQSLNRYAYVNNDPVNFTDPSGLQPKAGDSCTAGDGQPGIVDGDGKCNPGLREVVTAPVSGEGRLNDGLASLAFGRMALDYFLWQQLGTPLDRAYNLALAALNNTNKPACRNLFGNNVDPAQMLTDLRNGTPGVGSLSYSDLGGLRQDGTVRNASTHANTITRGGVTTVISATIIINNNAAAPFQAGYANAAGISAYRSGLSQDVNNAITLIHELGHVAARLHPGANTTQMTPDARNANASETNSRMVYDACFTP